MLRKTAFLTEIEEYKKNTVFKKNFFFKKTPFFMKIDPLDLLDCFV
jgi:hypothetical protein